MECLKIFQCLCGDKLHADLNASFCEERSKQTLKSGSLTDLQRHLLMLTVPPVLNSFTVSKFILNRKRHLIFTFGVGAAAKIF